MSGTMQQTSILFLPIQKEFKNGLTRDLGTTIDIWWGKDQRFPYPVAQEADHDVDYAPGGSYPYYLKGVYWGSRTSVPARRVCPAYRKCTVTGEDKEGLSRTLSKRRTTLQGWPETVR